MVTADNKSSPHEGEGEVDDKLRRERPFRGVSLSLWENKEGCGWADCMSAFTFDDGAPRIRARANSKTHAASAGKLMSGVAC
jgi:hypothetical protein